jgi:hypothetical protein
VEELRKAARALVLRVADGDDVPIDALREFAALTLQRELVQLAQRLQHAPPEFAVRRAMELASLALTLSAKPQVAGAGGAPEAAACNRDLSEGKGAPDADGGAHRPRDTSGAVVARDVRPVADTDHATRGSHLPWERVGHVARDVGADSNYKRAFRFTYLAT